MNDEPKCWYLSFPWLRMALVLITFFAANFSSMNCQFCKYLLSNDHKKTHLCFACSTYYIRPKMLYKTFLLNLNAAAVGNYFQTFFSLRNALALNSSAEISIWWWYVINCIIIYYVQKVSKTGKRRVIKAYCITLHFVSPKVHKSKRTK